MHLGTEDFLHHAGTEPCITPHMQRGPAKTGLRVALDERGGEIGWREVVRGFPGTAFEADLQRDALGLPHGDYAIDWGRVITHMLTIKGIYGREMYDTWYAMSSMLQTSAALRTALGSVITHRFVPEEFDRAFEVVRSGRCGKVLIDWS